MREVEVKFAASTRYEFDEDDPAFKTATDEEIAQIAKYMFFVDLFLSTQEEDILPSIEVTIRD